MYLGPRIDILTAPDLTAAEPAVVREPSPVAAVTLAPSVAPDLVLVTA